MDLTQIQHLDDQQKERYMALSKVFGMTGWAHLREWANASYEDARERGSSADSWDKNRVAFGERITYDIFRNLEEIMEAQFVALSEENAKAKGKTEPEDEDDGFNE